ncbi:BTB/POZ domain-containing protein 17-like isoform X2 [Dreissena polymorpha]|uniref:BTB/POZ domain-containing protein 17-like isoform X2 n=1 Tax=Dreissena polymorpha TaxID=45954 RepID=UPI002264126F|nr:BTB/POZ domain-containing protein 17-like isoform X2 [Dreissena polymorpha]
MSHIFALRIRCRVCHQYRGYVALSQALNSPEGINCFGNERLYLHEQAKLCNNEKLSDVTLVVGGKKYYAHKIKLVTSSDVFETMLTGEWKDSNKKELELVEEPMCVNVFPRFLQFLYSCNIKLNMENSLPVFVLADKYNVTDLQNVCINFACTYIIPKLQLKDVFHVWFQYATKCVHRALVMACIKAMAEKMDEIIGSLDWEREWLDLDKYQLIEFLESSDLKVRDEFDLWKATRKWLTSPAHTERTHQLEDNLRSILPYIRFPMMTAEQLYEVENSMIMQENCGLFQKYLMSSYKYHALPLSMRACVKEFSGRSFLLRNFSDLRWDCRFVVHNYSTCVKGEEKGIRFSTRASSYPSQTWDWELKIYPKGISTTSDDFRVVLYSNLILDQPRPMEYLLSLVSRDEVIHSVCGKKNFSKTRYMIDTELDKKVSLAELCMPNSPLLVDDCLILQIILKPAE